MSGFDPITVIEASYRFDGSDKSWMSGILETVESYWDDDHGVGMFDVSLDEEGRPSFSNMAFRAENPEVLARVVRAMNRDLSDEQIEHTYRKKMVYGTLSERMAPVLSDFTQDPVYRKFGHPLGVYDFCAARIADPSGTMFIMGAPLSEVSETTEQERQLWSRLAAHIAAAYRLRRRHKPASLDADEIKAVLSVDGEVLHLSRETTDADESRDRLERAAEAIGRARGDLREARPDRAVELWRALVDGRYSLVEHVDTDGKKYLITRRNAPYTVEPSALTPRERQVVRFAVLGHDDELIGYELGLSRPTVSQLLKKSLEKLALESRDDLAGLSGIVPGGREASHEG